jgi:3'(2'), 5'-bisphosphate nucleotidase
MLKFSFNFNSRHFSTGGQGRHWILDPVDGTLGFVRGDQYAIALAMMEDGRASLATS